MFSETVALEGAHIRLEPLRPEHAAALLEVAQGHEEIWTWMPVALTSLEAMQRFIAQAMAAEHAGTEYAFAVIVKDTGQVVGSTRYMDVQASHRGLEIGWTWYAPAVWGTVVNAEAKLLLLAHAFETWGAMRVQLKTDHMNIRSRAAIRKLGAQYEGTLRNHRLRPDGTVRHSVLFSITSEEWPAVKAGLLERIQGGSGRGAG